MKKRNINEFIEEATRIHGSKYSYEKSKYVDSWTKLIIICPIHGSWEQEPANHLAGHGCMRCKIEQLANQKRSSVDDFITKSRRVHGERYDYINVEYVNTKTKVEILCERHGPFLQQPFNHLRGSGCPDCGRGTSKGENQIRQYLIQQEIRFEEQKTFDGLMGKRKHLQFDFWLPDHKMLIEFDGIQHHRPESFTSDSQKARQNFRDLQQSDKKKEAYAKKYGYKLLRIRYNQDIIGCLSVCECRH